MVSEASCLAVFHLGADFFPSPVRTGWVKSNQMAPPPLPWRLNTHHSVLLDFTTGKSLETGVNNRC